MRICLVNEYFPPFAPGGAEWSLVSLASALARKGHDVTIVTPNYGAPRDERRDGFRVIRFAFPLRLPPGRTPASAKWLANPLTYLYAAAAVFRAARRVRAELLHVQNKHMLIPGAIAARLLGIPVFLTIRDGSVIDAAPLCLHHGDRRPADCGVRKLWRECSEEYFELYTRGRRGRLRTKLAFLYFWLDSLLKQRFLGRVDGVIGVSDGILDIYRRSGLLVAGTPARTIYNLPPRIAPADPGQADALRARLGVAGRRVVLYVGKFSPGKGTADLAAAAEHVVAEFPDTVFVFVGAGDPGVRGEHVRVTGALPNADVLALYPLADVVVLPSVIPDALSRVLLEAMAAGRPIVATRVGGTPEVVADEETGLLVDRRAPDQLAKAIGRLLGDAELRARLGAAARRRVTELFAEDRSLDRLVTMYDERLAAVRAGRRG
jgi:glycosyltransferase involved in cell wall biosynthesis